MKKVRALVVSVLGLSFAGGYSQANELRVSGGSFWLNGSLVKRSVSMSINPFRFLYVWVPGRGLITLSNREFPGSVEAGRMDGSGLSFDVNGIKGAVVSNDRASVVSTEKVYAKVDPSFITTSNTAMLGYGSTEMIPYEHPSFFR